MEPDDQELIDRTLAGSLASFDPLVRRYERLVFKIAFSYTRDRDAAFDVAQNTFLKAYDRLAGFQATGSFRAWLLRIAYHEAIDWVRVKNRLDAREDPDSATEALPARDDQEGELLERERWRLLARGLGELNHRSRLAVVLRYLQAMPLREIAAVLDTSEGVVKSMLFRGVRKLRDTLAEAA